MLEMLRRTLVALAAVVGLGAAAAASAAEGSYASVNGLKMYYEIEGTGRPPVLLHGGLLTIEGCLGKIRPALAKRFSARPCRKENNETVD